jgi:hypothetical protein
MVHGHITDMALEDIAGASRLMEVVGVDMEVVEGMEEEGINITYSEENMLLD